MKNESYNEFRARILGKAITEACKESGVTVETLNFIKEQLFNIARALDKDLTTGTKSKPLDDTLDTTAPKKSDD